MSDCLFCGDLLLLKIICNKTTKCETSLCSSKDQHLPICNKGSLYMYAKCGQSAQLSTSPEENNCHISCETDLSRQPTSQVKGDNKIHEAVTC